MEIEHGSDVGNVSALERARLISQALADAARKARFSTRSRRALSSGGFQARRGARLMLLIFRAGFVLLVAAPSLLSSVYYGLIAADQYVAEAQFTVTGGDRPSTDAIGSLTGIPAVAIVRDTQIVANYILSRAAVEQLEQKVGLKARFSDRKADFLARFDPSETIEELVRYWKRMVDISIKMPSGIVALKIRAFSPEDAEKLADGAIIISEDLINEMNNRMNADAVRSAEQELDRAANRLKEARIALETARNVQGILDVNKTAEMSNRLLTDLRSALLSLQREYAAQRGAVSENAPQMRSLKTRIESTDAQIKDLEAKLTSMTVTAGGETLSQLMTTFAALDLERQIAERLYNGAVAALEAARTTAEFKLMYINAFLRPVRPQEPQYPHRLLYPLITLLSGLTLWGITCGLAVLVRDHMA